MDREAWQATAHRVAELDPTKQQQKYGQILANAIVPAFLCYKSMSVKNFTCFYSIC